MRWVGTGEVLSRRLELRGYRAEWERRLGRRLGLHGAIAGPERPGFRLMHIVVQRLPDAVDITLVIALQAGRHFYDLVCRDFDNIT